MRNGTEALSRERRRGSGRLEGRRDDAQVLPAGRSRDDPQGSAAPDPSDGEPVSGEQLTTLLTTRGTQRERPAAEVLAGLMIRRVGAPGFEPGTFWSQTRLRRCEN